MLGIESMVTGECSLRQPRNTIWNGQSPLSAVALGRRGRRLRDLQRTVLYPSYPQHPSLGWHPVGILHMLLE